VHRAASALVYNANGNDVELVMVGGRVVVENGACTLVDEREILLRAQSRVDALRAKLAAEYPVFALRD
jgi:5-methylthioadenosine/S-adenosylhomocysteine deaminase